MKTENHAYVGEIEITTTGTFRRHPRVPGLVLQAGVSVKNRERYRVGATRRYRKLRELMRRDMTGLWRDTPLKVEEGFIVHERRCCRDSTSLETAL